MRDTFIECIDGALGNVVADDLESSTREFERKWKADVSESDHADNGLPVSDFFDQICFNVHSVKEATVGWKGPLPAIKGADRRNNFVALRFGQFRVNRE